MRYTQKQLSQRQAEYSSYTRRSQRYQILYRHRIIEEDAYYRVYRPRTEAYRQDLRRRREQAQEQYYYIPTFYYNPSHIFSYLTTDVQGLGEEVGLPILPTEPFPSDPINMPYFPPEFNDQMILGMVRNAIFDDNAALRSPIGMMSRLLQWFITNFPYMRSTLFDYQLSIHLAGNPDHAYPEIQFENQPNLFHRVLDLIQMTYQELITSVRQSMHSMLVLPAIQKPILDRIMRTYAEIDIPPAWLNTSAQTQTIGWWCSKLYIDTIFFCTIHILSRLLVVAAPRLQLTQAQSWITPAELVPILYSMFLFDSSIFHYRFMNNEQTVSRIRITLFDLHNLFCLVAVNGLRFMHSYPNFLLGGQLQENTELHPYNLTDALHQYGIIISDYQRHGALHKLQAATLFQGVILNQRAYGYKIILNGMRGNLFLDMETLEYKTALPIPRLFNFTDRGLDPNDIEISELARRFVNYLHNQHAELNSETFLYLMFCILKSQQMMGAKPQGTYILSFVSMLVRLGEFNQDEQHEIEHVYTFYFVVDDLLVVSPHRLLNLIRNTIIAEVVYALLAYSNEDFQLNMNAMQITELEVYSAFTTRPIHRDLYEGPGRAPAQETTGIIAVGQNAQPTWRSRFFPLNYYMLWRLSETNRAYYRGDNASMLYTLRNISIPQAMDYLERIRLCRYHSIFCRVPNLQDMLEEVGALLPEINAVNCVDTVVQFLQDRCQVSIPTEFNISHDLFTLFSFIIKHQQSFTVRIMVYIVASNSFISLCQETHDDESRPLLIFGLFADHVFYIDIYKLKKFRSEKSRPLLHKTKVYSTKKDILLADIAPVSKRVKDVLTIFFDIETFTKEPFAAYAVGYSFDSEHCNFLFGPQCLLDFLELLKKLSLENPKRVIQVIAFNGLKFDYIYLLPLIIYTWGSRTQLTGSKTNIKVLRVGNIWFDDLRSLLGGTGSLRHYTSSLLKHRPDLQKGNFDYDSITSFDYIEGQREKLEEYLKIDVLAMSALFDVLKEYLSNICGTRIPDSRVSISLSSITLKYIFRFFIDDESASLFRSCLHKHRDLFRLSYHGGRVTCANVFPVGVEPDTLIESYLDYIDPRFNFRKSDGPLHYLDINSSYPFAMTTNMPCGTYYRRVMEEKHVWKNTNLYIVESFHFTFDPMLPIVSENGLLLYPKEYIGPEPLLIWGVELKEALYRDAEISVIGYYEWSHEKPLFKNFIDNLYERRLAAKAEKNTALTEILKLVMNSLSGKLGQRTFPSTCIMHSNDFKTISRSVESVSDFVFNTDYLLDQMPDQDNEKYIKKLIGVQHITNDYMQLKFENSPEWDIFSPGAFVHLISYITAFGRARLDKFQRKAGMGHHWYSDTDSIVVDGRGFRELEKYLHPTRLGFLKEEYTLRFFHCMSPKFYFGECMDGRIIARAKGINLKNIEKNNEALIKFYAEAASKIDSTIDYTYFRRQFGVVDIRGMVKSAAVKRTLTEINMRTGDVRPPQHPYDVSFSPKTFSEIFYYL